MAGGWRRHFIDIPDKSYLSAAEVGRLLGGVKGKTVIRWAKNGTFPPPRVIEGRMRWQNVAVGLWLAFQPYWPQPYSPWPPPGSQAQQRIEEEEERDDGPGGQPRRGRE